MSAARAKSFLNGWTLKDFLVLATIIGGIIHGESKGVDVSNSASEAVHHGIEHFEAQLATLSEHQHGQDAALGDHETRIRVLEHPTRPTSGGPGRRQLEKGETDGLGDGYPFPVAPVEQGDVAFVADQ